MNSPPKSGATAGSNPALAVQFADVRAAQQTLANLLQPTPVLRSEAADQRAGAQLYFKCESLQRTGSFKFRGAYNAISPAP